MPFLKWLRTHCSAGAVARRRLVAIGADPLLAKEVVRRRPEILVHQDAAGTLMADRAIVLGLTARMAGVTVAALEARIMRIGMVADQIAAVAVGAGDAVYFRTFMTRVAVVVLEAGGVGVGVLAEDIVSVAVRARDTVDFPIVMAGDAVVVLEA